MTSDTETLVVEKRVRAPIERVFEAWTTASQLIAWWGPDDVVCIGATIDLRVGGHYRIGNQLADGQVIWISGTYEDIMPPNRLVFSWSIDQGAPSTERVTVNLQSSGDGTATQITVTHERIRDIKAREGHAVGWTGCLDGLEVWANRAGHG